MHTPTRESPGQIIHTSIYTAIMAKRRKSRPGETGSERVIFTIPRSLVAEVATYARVLRNGNKSGFVADAIRSYIQYFHKCRHTELLRRSYAAAAAKGRIVNRAWEPLDDETWARLDLIEKHGKSTS
jgi:hypothetical protein